MVFTSAFWHTLSRVEPIMDCEHHKTQLKSYFAWIFFLGAWGLERFLPSKTRIDRFEQRCCRGWAVWMLQLASWRQLGTNLKRMLSDSEPMILWMILVKISDAMHAWIYELHCLLWISIWNWECTLSYTLAVILANDLEQRGQFHWFVLHAQYLWWLNMGTDAETIGIVPHAPATDISNPKLCQKNPGMWDCQCVLLALAACTITISGKSPSHWCRWSLQPPGNFLGTRDRSHGRENSVAWKNEEKTP